MLDTDAFTDKVMVAGVFPLDGVTVRKLPPVLGTKVAVKGTLAPPPLAGYLDGLRTRNRHGACAATLNDALLAESEIADVCRGNVQRHGNIERTGAGTRNDHSYYARVSALRKLRPVGRDSYCIAASRSSKPASAAQHRGDRADCRFR